MEQQKEFLMKPLGFINSPIKSRNMAPRQGARREDIKGEIKILPQYQDGLKGLEDFERIIVIFAFHKSESYNVKVHPPGEKGKRGLFSTRSPHRPNPIGMTVVRLLKIRGDTISIAGLDMLNGAPILDIKPYIPVIDAYPNAKEGWTKGGHPYEHPRNKI